MRAFFAALIVALVAALAVPAHAGKKRMSVKTHRVARGNTLGKIAKRYQITVDALCHANDIPKNKPIKISGIATMVIRWPLAPRETLRSRAR